MADKNKRIVLNRRRAQLKEMSVADRPYHKCGIAMIDYRVHNNGIYRMNARLLLYKKFLPTPNSTASASSSIAEMIPVKVHGCLNRSYKNIRTLPYSLHTAALQRKRLLCCKPIQTPYATLQWQTRKQYHALQQQVSASALCTAAIFRYRIGVPYILNTTRRKQNSNSFYVQQSSNAFASAHSSKLRSLYSCIKTHKPRRGC